MKSIDWGSWTSLLLIAAVCLAVGWRLTPGAPVEPEAAALPAPQVAPAVAAAVPDGGVHPSGYRLNTPDATTVLSDTLSEISDLALAPDGESLWVVHDEKGTLYRIATADGTVLQTIDFHKKGDFEGVAFVDGKVIAGRSDGVLFVVDPKTGVTTHFATPLGVVCNLEGLAWEPRTQRLLLACKSPLGAKAKRAWPVYALNLATRELQKEPLFVVTRKAIEEHLASHLGQPGLTASMALEFDPSGISIDPRSGRIFMISTRARMLAVLDPAGALLSLEPLDRAVHPQPEGIAFTPDGTLFISSEARGRKALLLRFGPDVR